MLGVGVSIALLTQIEGEVWARAGILIGVGLVLWLINELLLKRLQPRQHVASAAMKAQDRGSDRGPGAGG